MTDPYENRTHYRFPLYFTLLLVSNSQNPVLQTRSPPGLEVSRREQSAQGLRPESESSLLPST